MPDPGEDNRSTAAHDAKHGIIGHKDAGWNKYRSGWKDAS
jgi:hypothetical protein